MKKQITFLKKHSLRFIKDESGQGTTEYILILVAIVGLAIAFKGQIATAVGEKMNQLSGDIQGFRPQ